MARDRGGPKLLHQLLMYPVLGGPDDGRPSYKENAEGYGLTPAAMHWFVGHYTRSPADLDNPYVCPIRAKDLSGLPPATILTAEYDLLPRRRRGVRASARRSWRALHCFPLRR